MIYELARLAVDPGRTVEFEAAVERCVDLFRRATGCRSMALEREIETPGRYLLRVGWDTVDDHMVTFRGSADFARWREDVGGFFTAATDVCHAEPCCAMGF